jgi:hypothetical protein
LTFIAGSRHPVYIQHGGMIQIGCIFKPLDWWKENRVSCGEREDYSPAQIAEYGMYIELAEKLIQADEK